MYVVSDEQLTRGPGPICESLADWLQAHGIELQSSAADIDRAAASITPELRSVVTDETEGGLLPSIRALTDVLRRADGAHEAWVAPVLPLLSEWSEDTMATQRRMANLTKRFMDLAQGNRVLSDDHQELIKTCRELVAVGDDRLSAIRDLRADEETRMRQIEQLGARVEELQRLLDSQRRGQEEAELRALTFSAEIEQLRSSTSWRLTAPFRAAVGALHSPQRDRPRVR